jgi:hypothetical protein
MSEAVHDAVSQEGKHYQIKLGAGKSVALNGKPDWLLVLTLHNDGSITEFYDGRGDVVWDACGKLQKNGQRSIRKSKLARLSSKPDS